MVTRLRVLAMVPQIAVVVSCSRFHSQGSNSCSLVCGRSLVSVTSAPFFLLHRLLPGAPLDVDAVIAWSLWRRRHQQRARRSHWKRRTQTDKARL
ncbi:hypothetical protein C1S70_30995 (plasmid) [Azospirillum argentinense]|uniref:Uncharacterized protein n=1 Tax=Azospirillum argentinense TaxID=2970906 RepID=A0A2K1FR74_9PROT|nr:hypothetical protein C1S70_30995 [Azospirillum argentinense]